MKFSLQQVFSAACLAGSLTGSYVITGYRAARAESAVMEVSEVRGDIKAIKAILERVERRLDRLEPSRGK